MKQELTNHLTWAVNRLSEMVVYKEWNNTTRTMCVEETFSTFYKSLEKNKLIDFNNLTVEEVKELRFGKWIAGLWLFPLWLVPLIPEGLEVTTISGETVKYNKSMDNDVRFGCVAYGIKIQDKKEDCGQITDQGAD